MKKLGIIGGTSWNSTRLYYDHINTLVARRMGGLHSARLVLESLDLAPYAALQMKGKTDEAEKLIVAAGLSLLSAGAEAILIASNTTNRYGPAVARATGLPLLPIADPTIAALKKAGHRRIALLGTRYTMIEDFGRTPYEDAGLDVVPIAPDWIATVDRIIFDELAKGVVRRDSQRAFKTLFTELDRAKVDAVVLGCTELVLAVDPRANVLPVFDTTELHARSAVDWMLSDEEGAKQAA
ncbi:aspartate/glutamate racemase family protein [Sphingomicrobium clamense]|uniref:Amino acid racemase n=1 Tax=Sphingomicrobium clamense TaxID=2851013 RepID=A0ABS6V6W8_9SPHN|nr:amino acid racemase [Sphingomicrobium sp. B8]MBW0145309.1 amino acid racemase [Sphingomicrobium sp. B8]